MTKNILSYITLSIIGLVTLMSSCQHDDYDNLGEITDKVREVSFVITLPTFSVPEKKMTRSMGTKESEVNRIDVLIFEKDGSGVESLMYKSVGTNIDQTSNIVKFKSQLKQGSNLNIVLVANASIDNSIVSAIEGFPIGTLKTDILPALLVNNLGKWASDESSPTGYTAIPMYAETGDITISSSSRTIDGIQLRRILARVDVEVTTSDFTLANVYLCNYNTKGYISPAWNPTTGAVSMSTSIFPNIPNDPEPQLGEANVLKYSVVGGMNNLTSEIYTFEAYSTNDANEMMRQNATCLVVEGLYKGQTYFYRIDFTYDSGTDKGEYMPLLRNHRYVVNIVEAAGIGYNTLGEALDSYTVVSNLRTRVLNYDESNMKDINYNGQYWLALSDDNYIAGKNGGMELFSFNTDYPEGAEIVSFTEEEGGGLPVTWISQQEIAGGPGNLKNIMIEVSELSSGAPDVRVGYVNVKAGRLLASFEIIQTRFTPNKASNCYMLKPGGDPVLIPVSRAEEGIPGSLSRRNNLKEEYVWLDNTNGIGSTGSIAEAKVYGKSKKALLWVKPGNKPGNVVIAVKDEKENQTKWSWHMWVTNYSPDSALKFMDRNLGALTTFSTMASDGLNWWDTRGVFFQWGRKDAFPNMYDRITTPPIHFRLYGYDENGNKINIDHASFNDLSTSVSNPLLFSDGISKAWNGSNGNNSWGYNGEKSIFDPSPEGWRIVNALTDITDLTKANFSDYGGWNTTNLTTLYRDPQYSGGYIYTSYGDGFGDYPAGGGLFYGANSGEVVNNDVSKIGYIWTAQPHSTVGRSYVFKVTNTVVGDGPDNSIRDRGFAIRCVRE